MRTAQNGNRRRASLCSPVLLFSMVLRGADGGYLRSRLPPRVLSSVLSADGDGRVGSPVDAVPGPDDDRIPDRRSRVPRRRRRRDRRDARRRGDAARRLLSDATRGEGISRESSGRRRVGTGSAFGCTPERSPGRASGPRGGSPAPGRGRDGRRIAQTRERIKTE
ncbi:pr106 [rat cytomegalovirus strain Maastricht]|uniref:Pr106 n=1 Tax=Rat cytomegalovirus (strain Maastricht) TaxID=79700 RepID=Q9DW95_RCMVM|nr:pr106 [rat cytomegalovirus strain Maastricht]AAF99195.1 pr106 [rat cytomegalovirus strain Maastricht]